MSIKIVSSIAGSVTTIGGGIGIYLLKNNTNNPPPNLEEKAQKIPKKTRTWKEITESSEYQAASTTGKTLNFTTFSSDEAADNNANYFLMEKNTDSNHSNEDEDIQVKEIKIEINDWLLLEITIDKKFSELPFFCFEDENVSSIEELNFNKLKKCKSNASDKYMIIFSGTYSGASTIHNSSGKNFFKWHNDESTVKIEMQKCQHGTYSVNGKMLKIFRQQYIPTINNSTS